MQPHLLSLLLTGVLVLSVLLVISYFVIRSESETKKLEFLASQLNEQIGEEVFVVKEGFNSIMNVVNRYEGNDMDISEYEDGTIELRMTGYVERWKNIDDAIEDIVALYKAA